jgi:hypothetical protein
MKRRRLVPLIGGVVVVVSAFCGYRYYTQRPTYSLQALGRAIEARDVAAAERYVDFRAVSTQIVDEIVDAASEQFGPRATGPESGFALLGEAMGLALLDRMKPSMVRMFERQMRRAVTTGRVDSPGPVTSGEPTSVASGGLLREFAGEGATSFAGYGGTRVQGDSAFVDLRFYDPDLDTTLSLVAAMARSGNRWRVVGLKNIGDLAVSLDSLQARRLERANQPIRQRLARMVGVGRLHSELRQDDWFDRKLVLRAAVSNRTRVPLEGVVVRVTGRGLSPSDERKLVLLQPRLEPGAVGEGRHVMEYNQVVTEHRALGIYPSQYQLWPERLVALVGGRRDTMQIFADWESYRLARARARRQR